MFVVKKIIAHFLFPFPLCLEILLVGLFFLFFTKKQRTGKIIVSIGIAMLILFGNFFFSHSLIRKLEQKHPPLLLNSWAQEDGPKNLYSAKWIVVLGGGAISDPNLPVTNHLCAISHVRLLEAIRLYREIPGSKLVLSGGKVFNTVPEAEIMAEIATEIVRVKPEDIILESQSMDTSDEARRIKPIVGNDTFILVTSASHMPRSVAMFKKLGMNPVPAPTEFASLEPPKISPGLFFPAADSLETTRRAFYEYLGLIWAKLRGYM